MASFNRLGIVILCGRYSEKRGLSRRTVGCYTSVIMYYTLCSLIQSRLQSIAYEISLRKTLKAAAFGASEEPRDLVDEQSSAAHANLTPSNTQHSRPSRTTAQTVTDAIRNSAKPSES